VNLAPERRFSGVGQFWWRMEPSGLPQLVRAVRVGHDVPLQQQSKLPHLRPRPVWGKAHVALARDALMAAPTPSLPGPELDRPPDGATKTCHRIACRSRRNARHQIRFSMAIPWPQYAA
jgi:hypothetical protein